MAVMRPDGYATIVDDEVYFLFGRCSTMVRSGGGAGRFAFGTA